MSGTNNGTGNEGQASSQNQDTSEESSPQTYMAKKTAVEGMFDVGMMLANSAQLSTLITNGTNQKFYEGRMVLLILSLTLQVVVAFILVIHGYLEKTRAVATGVSNILNNVTIALVLAIAITNIFITSFSV